MVKTGDRIRIIGYKCGKTCQSKYSCMGMIKGIELEIVAIQPHGPITVRYGNTDMTIGREMFEKLDYELVKD